jgi:hypothetical protein
MRTSPKNRGSIVGISLVETIVSIGVLSVVIPLALAAMLKASNSGASARAETRAPSIADYCMVELRAARDGDSKFFDPIMPRTNFGGSGEFMCLGFGRDGAVLGEVSEADYQKGLFKIEDEQVYYLAKLSGKLDASPRELDLVTVTVDVEYPATKPEDKRSSASFYTKLP